MPIMSQRKPLAALAAVTAAAALVVPASASATTTAPAVREASIGFAPGSLPCLIDYNALRLAFASGNTVLANFLSNVFVYSGCGGAAI
jgi:hypothetical protein